MFTSSESVTGSPFIRFGISNGYLFSMSGANERYIRLTSPIIYIKKGTSMIAQYTDITNGDHDLLYIAG